MTRPIERHERKVNEGAAVKGIWNLHEFDVKGFKHLTDEELEKAFYGSVSIFQKR